MTTFKDLFSHHATDYARFRPHYPPELFAWLAGLSPGRALAVDVGSGNGQAAAALGQDFDQVIAVDPSAEQIANAPVAPAGTVGYRKGTAECLPVDSGTADLVVAAQAFHWFKPEPFFAEVRRVLRPCGHLAVWCYGLATITPELDALVHELYETRLGPSWEPERRLVETGYSGVAFPFTELTPPRFDMRLAWTFDHLVGYLGTWSALKRHLQTWGDNPLEDMVPRLAQAWGKPRERKVLWPIHVRAFRL